MQKSRIFCVCNENKAGDDKIFQELKRWIAFYLRKHAAAPT